MSTVPSSSSTSISSQFTYSNGSYFPTPFHLQQPQYAALPQPSLPAAVPMIPTASVVPSVYSAAPGVYTLPQFQQVIYTFTSVWCILFFTNNWTRTMFYGLCNIVDLLIYPNFLAYSIMCRSKYQISLRKQKVEKFQGRNKKKREDLGEQCFWILNGRTFT